MFLGRLRIRKGSGNSFPVEELLKPKGVREERSDDVRFHDPEGTRKTPFHEVSYGLGRMRTKKGSGKICFFRIGE
jgi:hypothetical protein